VFAVGFVLALLVAYGLGANVSAMNSHAAASRARLNPQQRQQQQQQQQQMQSVTMLCCSRDLGSCTPPQLQ
jgi:hypothetical protein